MFIAWITYHLFKKQHIEEIDTCPSCKKWSRLRSFTAWQVFAPYFIPLIPIGRVRVVGRCDKCRKMLKFSPTGKKLRDLISQKRELAARHLDTSPGDSLTVAAALMHLGDLDGAQSVIQLLLEVDEALGELAKVRYLDLTGESDQVEQQYRTLIEARPHHGRTRYEFGRFLVRQRRQEEAVAELLHATELDPHALDLRWLLIDLLRTHKEWPNLAHQLAGMFQIDPTLQHDKKIAKLYRQACKKAGIRETSPQ